MVSLNAMAPLLTQACRHPAGHKMFDANLRHTAPRKENTTTTTTKKKTLRQKHSSGEVKETTETEGGERETERKGRERERERETKKNGTRGWGLMRREEGTESERGRERERWTRSACA